MATGIKRGWYVSLKLLFCAGFKTRHRNPFSASHPALTWSKLTMKTLEQGVKYVQS